jgi:hypothetical protein
MKTINKLFFLIFLFIIFGYRYYISLQTENYTSIQFLILKYESIQLNKNSENLVKVRISNDTFGVINKYYSENSKQIKKLFDLFYTLRSHAKVNGNVISKTKLNTTFKVSYIYSNSINLYILFNVNPKNEIYLKEIIGKISFKEKSDCLKSL